MRYPTLITRKHQRYRLWWSLGACLVAAAVTTACSSSAATPDTSSAQTSGALGASLAHLPKPTGERFKIMAIGEFQSTIESLPETDAGVEARIDAYNAAGGKIELISCNSQYNPNVGLACARQAVS